MNHDLLHIIDKIVQNTAVIAGLSPMNSPSGMHVPASPFMGRPSSNTSASPYIQPPQTPHYQHNLQSPMCKLYSVIEGCCI